MYDKFFKTAFKATTEKLGIVFTPIEVVDFIVHSVDDVLKKHFGKSLASKDVHILDPFTGTGTFIVRTLTYLKDQMDAGEISLADITRKFMKELHANEIILLSYYIAAINIESTFDEINGDEEGYIPFEGIVLTDTFESTETEDTLDDDYFGTNDERLKRQQEVPITAIIVNPPYSMGQVDENEINNSTSYFKLTDAITNSYVRLTDARRVVSVYDSYLKAFRWATDRLASNGVIGFITNSSFVDFKTMNGVRRSFENEFNYVYVLNLRGAIKERLGELAKKEGQNVFDIMTGVAITILIKDGSQNHDIYYYDIGDYLTRKDKFDYLEKTYSMINVDWLRISPDENGDWINKRDKNYLNYVPMGNDSSTNYTDTMFKDSAIGVTTSRDSWVYNFGKKHVFDNSAKLVRNYNNERERLSNYLPKQKLDYINTDSTYMSWSRKTKTKLSSNISINHDERKIVKSSYRPYTYKWLYYDTDIVEMPGRFKDFLGENNKVIYVSGPGVKRDFSVIMTSAIPEYKYIEKGRGFYYSNNGRNGFFGTSEININSHYGLTEEEIFFYIYGVLHSSEYRKKYANDLQKALPRIPLLKNKEKYLEIGSKLADLHLNYEDQPIWEGVEVEISKPNYLVKKMKHPKKGILDTIIFNDSITIKNIPEKAYEYIVNGRPAIEWIIDQYQVKTDEKSGITDDPNDFSDDPKYILNLLLSVITVSMRTLELIDELPPFEVTE